MRATGARLVRACAAPLPGEPHGLGFTVQGLCSQMGSKGGPSPCLAHRHRGQRFLCPSPSIYSAHAADHRTVVSASGLLVPERAADESSFLGFGEGRHVIWAPFPEHRLGATQASPSKCFPEWKALIVLGTGGHILSVPEDGFPTRRGAETPSRTLTGSSLGPPTSQRPALPAALGLVLAAAARAPSRRTLGWGWVAAARSHSSLRLPQAPPW